MYPLAFTDWVRQGSTRRLSYGLPQRGGKVPQGVVQKAVAAVQNLKSKYGIQDGDSDVVTVKEFLTALTGNSAGGIVPAASLNPIPATPQMATQTAVAPAPQQAKSSDLDVWKRDFNYHQQRLSEGIPGLEKEVTDFVYKAEHLEERDAAATLLRNVIEIAVVYLIIGVAYKHQALGARGVDMIPHIGFWMEYPQLVRDGIEYTRQLAGDVVGMDFSSEARTYAGGGFEPMGRGERDTFAHFEPSKA
jgi:hypothetical protein